MTREPRQPDVRRDDFPEAPLSSPLLPSRAPSGAQPNNEMSFICPGSVNTQWEKRVIFRRRVICTLSNPTSALTFPVRCCGTHITSSVRRVQEFRLLAPTPHKCTSFFSRFLSSPKSNACPHPCCKTSVSFPSSVYQVPSFLRTFEYEPRHSHLVFGFVTYKRLPM